MKRAITDNLTDSYFYIIVSQLQRNSRQSRTISTCNKTKWQNKSPAFTPRHKSSECIDSGQGLMTTCLKYLRFMITPDTPTHQPGLSAIDETRFTFRHCRIRTKVRASRRLVTKYLIHSELLSLLLEWWARTAIKIFRVGFVFD